MKAQRVEKQMIKPTNEYFPMLDQFCFLSKNLYNHANYIVRQSFVKDNKWIRYGELDKQLRADKDYPDYAEMPTAQAAQQTLRLLDKNWKSFLHPSKIGLKIRINTLVNQNFRDMQIKMAESHLLSRTKTVN